MKNPKTLTVRFVERLGHSYGAEYYRSLSYAFIARTAAKLKKLNEVVKPKNECVSIILVLHALLMASESDGVTSTTLDIDDAMEFIEQLLTDSK